jgi:hypothetical protein
VRLAVLMLDGLELQWRTNIVALGHDRGRQDPARALGGLHRERDRGDGAALRPGRAWPRPRAGHSVRDRRRQGAAQSDPRRLRRSAGPALRAAQGTERARPSPRARPAAHEEPTAQGVGRARSDARAPTSCGCSQTSSSAPTPAPPARCAKAWRKRSRSPGSASRAP